MLDYPTCLKLKEAGFPFKKITDDVCMGVHVGVYITPPTLEELIEACGVEITSLHRKWDSPNDLVWVAVAGFAEGDYTMHTGESPKGEGVTPEEAVANLYLALNLKP